MIVENAVNAAQAAQIAKQFKLHAGCTEPSPLGPISLNRTTVLEGLEIHPGVLRPMSSRRLAAFLYNNRRLFKGKTVIDMGCGSGLQGIVAGVYGASRVILSDVTEQAYKNTRENVQRCRLRNCAVRRGDLFENVSECADVVVFAQPYFPGTPDPAYPFTYGMLDSGELIHRFLEQAKEHVRERIFMCCLDVAGDLNNPKVQAPKHGYLVVEHGPELLAQGEQQGWFWVHELILGGREQ